MAQDRYQLLRDLLIRARKDQKLAQHQLASRIGSDQSTISKIERGARRIDPIEFHDICRALDLDPTEVLSQIPLPQIKLQNKKRPRVSKIAKEKK